MIQQPELKGNQVIRGSQDMPLSRTLKPVIPATGRLPCDWKNYYALPQNCEYPYGRTKVSQPASWPHTCVGIVACRFQNGTVKSGVGGLIMGNFVLTCGSLVSTTDEQNPIKETWFVSFVGKNRGATHRVVRTHISTFPEKLQNRSVVLLQLPESLIESHGRLNMSSEATNMYDQPIVVYSYNQPNPYVLELCQQEKRLSNLNHSDLQLGSPVLIRSKNGNDYELIGVYVGSDSHAVFTTCHRYREWIQRCAMRSITEVVVENTRISRLAGYSGASGVETLQLHHSNLFNLAPTTAIDESFYMVQAFSQLQHLDIQSMRVSPNTIALIGVAWPGLRGLRIKNCPLGDEGFHELTKCKWQRLIDLSLMSCSISDQGIRSMRAAEWPSLRVLTLRQNYFTFQSCRVLYHMKWTNLTELDLASSLTHMNVKMAMDCLRGCFQHLTILSVMSHSRYQSRNLEGPVSKLRAKWRTVC